MKKKKCEERKAVKTLQRKKGMKESVKKERQQNKERKVRKKVWRKKGSKKFIKKER